MKKTSLILCVLFMSTIILSCGVSNKSILRQQKLEEGVQNPTSVEELKDAISKYEKRAADLQLTNQQVGIWYKILGNRYLDNKMYGEALKAFQKALEYYPNNQNLYYWVGVCAGYMSHAAMDFGGTGSSEMKYIVF